MTDSIVAVEVDLFDGSATQTLRLSNVGQITGISRASDPVAYKPLLITPIVLGPAISADSYGQAVRGSPNGNTIDFVVDESLWPYLGYNWIGRPFRVYQGSTNRVLTQVYTGRVGGFTFDAVAPKASITASDASIALDGPLISDLYENTALPALQGRPKPRLWGQGKSLAPTLEDDANQVYRVSSTPLDDVLEVRVGGVPWTRVSGTPGPAQWSADLANGTVTLGSVTLGGEVRCDARAVGWETLTSAALMTEIVAEAGLSVDALTIAQFASDAPQLIGFYATDPVNRLDMLDQIAASIGGFWTFGPEGTLLCGVIIAPAEGVDLALSEVEIKALQLTEIIPPVWRVRVEWQRNWQPTSQFFGAVTEADQQAMSAPGIVALAYQNDAIKANEPLAIDVPLINSLVMTEEDALAIGERLALAWSATRRLYTATANIDVSPLLYETVGVSFQMVQGNFRAHAALPSFGGVGSQLVLWG